MTTRARRYTRLLAVAIAGAALAMIGGCSPGAFPAPVPHGPPAPSTKGANKAAPHAFGAPFATPSKQDAGAD